MSKASKPFLFSGLVSLGLIYLAIVVILVLILALTQLDPGIFIGLFSAATVICGALAVVICLWGSYIGKTDAKTKKNLEKGAYKTPKRGGF